MKKVRESKYQCWEISGILWDIWSDTICLLVHGFQSNSKSRLMRNYAVSLTTSGLNTLRVDLYNKSLRNTMNVTFQDHLDDIDKVIVELKTRYKKVIYVGHSLWWAIGGLVVNNSLIDGMLLRDSAIPSIVQFESFLKVSSIDWVKCYQTIRSRRSIITIEYWNQLVTFNEEYFKNINCPYLAICCDQVWFYNHTKQFDSLDKKQKTILIPWSSHNFQQRWTEEKLFELSDAFLKDIWIL